MATTWRGGSWQPSDEECRKMAEAVLDMWYSPRGVSRLRIRGEELEGYSVVILNDDIWNALCSSVPPAYCGPTTEENT